MAAQRVYTRHGRAGFTFEAIAREAGVGKPALYRRWSSPDELMRDVLTSHVLLPAETLDFDIRSQLVEIALATLRLMQSEQGTFMLRVSAERGEQSELFDRYVQRVRDVIHVQNRDLIERAVERGTLTVDCDPDLLLLSITGSVLVGTLMGFAPDPGRDAEAASRYCVKVVDQALGGVLPGALRQG